MVKGHLSITQEYVVSWILFGFNPVWFEFWINAPRKIHACQNVAGTVAEEYPIRQVPPANGIRLYS